MKKNQPFLCQPSHYQRKALPQSQGSQLSQESGQGAVEGSGAGLNGCWSLIFPAHEWVELWSYVFKDKESKRCQLPMPAGKKINLGRAWSCYKNPISPSHLYFSH